MKRKVILGYPYTGAFYWLAEREHQYFGRAMKEKYTGSHPYYKTLYGKHDQSAINDCISLALLFDDIYIIGADARLPDIEPIQDAEILHSPDVNLNVFWDWNIMNSFALNDKDFEIHMRDDVIKVILNRVPKEAIRSILQHILIQNYVAERYDCLIIGSKNYIKLSRRMFELHNNIFQRTDIPLVDLKNYLIGFDKLFQLESIRFRVNSFTDFIELRQNKVLIDYSNNFASYLSGITHDNKMNELRLLEDMANIHHTDNLKRKIAGGLSIGATVIGGASLFAGPLGLLTGAVGVVTDLSSRILGGTKNNWIHLAPEINKTLTKQRIIDRIKELSTNN